MSLTDHHIRLLSAYSDREATPAEAREAEALLASSSDARAWLRDAGTLRSVSRRASDEALRRLNQTLPLTGEAIVAAAGRRGGWGQWSGRILRSPRAAGAVGILALGALLVGEYAFDGSEISPMNDAVVSAPSVTTPLAAATFAPAEERVEASTEASTASTERIDEPATTSASPVRKRVGRKGGLPSTPRTAKKAVDATPAPATWEGIAAQPFAMDMEVRIFLSSSSGMIIVNDGFMPQQLSEVRLEKDEDLLKVTERIDIMVDSLNASVGRIAIDRTQPAEERVRRIMIEQLRYREGIQMMLDKVRHDSGATAPAHNNGGSNGNSSGASNDDSMMNIDPALYQQERQGLPCPITEECSGIS